MKITKNIRQLILLWCFAIPLFFLGVGFVKYLGTSINWNAALLGLIWMILIGMGSVFSFSLSDELFKNPLQGKYLLREKPYKNLLLASGMIFVLLLVVTMSLVQTGIVETSLIFSMLFIFIVSFFQGISPVRIFFSGFGELSLALIIGFFIPTFSLQLQMQEVNRLFIFATLPLVFLILAFQILSQIEDYKEEIRQDEKRLVARLGWENSFTLHNISLILVFLFFGIASLLGLPNSISIPLFISFPLAGLQIWHLQQIANGGKPRWKFLKINSLVILVTIIIVLVVSFFIR